MAAPEALVRLFEPWSQLYGESTPIATLVVFGHVAALVFAGGLAVTLDRATLRAFREGGAAREHQLRQLAASHRVVVTGLGVSAVTGLLLLAADFEAIFESPIFWTKLVLIGVLLANGYGIVRAERQVRAGGPGAEAGWSALRRTAIASLVLWFLVAFVGVALAMAV